MLKGENSNLELPRLVLASASPRRAEILDSVGWEFVKAVPDIDESELEGESPEDYVLRLAFDKAALIAKRFPHDLVLGADTTVVIDGRIVGKPNDLDEARGMLRMLSGHWHEVLTAVAVVNGRESKTGIQRTRVKFAEMNEAEVAYLAERGDPLDKAGAYAVQAQAALFIEGIEGDYWNVVGLPISLVYNLVNGLISGRTKPAITLG